MRRIDMTPEGFFAWLGSAGVDWGRAPGIDPMGHRAWRGVRTTDGALVYAEENRPLYYLLADDRVVSQATAPQTTEGDQALAFFSARPAGECPCGRARAGCPWHDPAAAQAEEGTRLVLTHDSGGLRWQP